MCLITALFLQLSPHFFELFIFKTYEPKLKLKTFLKSHLNVLLNVYFQSKRRKPMEPLANNNKNIFMQFPSFSYFMSLTLTLLNFVKTGSFKEGEKPDQMTLFQSRTTNFLAIFWYYLVKKRNPAEDILIFNTVHWDILINSNVYKPGSSCESIWYEKKRNELRPDKLLTTTPSSGWKLEQHKINYSFVWPCD